MNPTSNKKHLTPNQEEQLFEHLHEQRYRQLIQGLPAAIYTCDAGGRVMLYNKAAVALWGREPEVGKDLWCGSWRIYKTDGSLLPFDVCPMAIALKEGRPVFGEELIIERPDGTRRIVLPHPKPIFNESGMIVEAVNMLVDITDHKSAELALRESEERFRTMADQAPNIVWMSDENGGSVYVNVKWSEFTGLAVEEGFGNGWIRNIHPTDLEKTRDAWLAAFAKRMPYDCRFRYANSRNEYRILNAHCSPRLSKEGKFMGYVSILTDVTLQENAKDLLESLVMERTRELIKANADLERSNTELEQFAFAASHDLQEPLRKIQVFTNLLIDKNKDNLTAESKTYLDRIDSAANKMTRLINDLLNFSKLSKDNEPFVGVDLNKVLESVRSDFDLLIKQKGAMIKCDRLPVIEAIQLQMHQLFYNLIGNAMKFQKDGVSPVISITCSELSSKGLHMHGALDKRMLHYRIDIKDNGIGFDPQFSKQIFSIFQRLNNNSAYEGSGIGLALCNKIVNNHHGEIYAESSEGDGAVFSVILPAKQK